MMRQVRGDRTA
ncbi:hypothetical protein S40285_10740 [Stachybotrys chlorohalonatus IBT 40285]|uniref:Uncharacterized protein n=1 Tax=Stachybotrys chlorohalonatus (strain IBT 40285) TaxID=1283841 RepID=A0A084R350_STAC4|nr:hypothetical protein S40285_10740 [Stachybotrys chlorohalonata IBT 40285]